MLIGGSEETTGTVTWAGYHSADRRGFFVITAVDDREEAVDDDEAYVIAFLQAERESGSDQFNTIRGWVGVNGYSPVGRLMVVQGGALQLIVNHGVATVDGRLRVAMVDPQSGSKHDGTCVDLELHRVRLKPAAESQLNSLLPEPGGPLDSMVADWRKDIAAAYAPPSPG